MIITPSVLFATLLVVKNQNTISMK